MVGRTCIKAWRAREREHRVFREQKIVQFIKVTAGPFNMGHSEDLHWDHRYG